MANAAKPIILTQVDTVDYVGPDPQPFVMMGNLPAAAKSVPVVVASGISHNDPGFPWPFAFDDGIDHTAMSDADFLSYVRRNYRVVQLGPSSSAGPGVGTPNGFGACPLWFQAADASAATVSIQTLDGGVPFEVV